MADAVGITARRISAFENEGETPSPATIQALADELKFPSAFFQLPDVELLEPERVSFRSYARLSARTRDMAVAAATLAAAVATWMNERFELPTADLPDLRDVGPGEAAAALRAIWGLGELPAPNMVHLLETHGIRVFSLVDDCVALDALSTWMDDMPFVFLTRHKSPERARWDAAHELAHLVLHLGMAPQGRELEDQADRFAGEFLMPERGVRARVSQFVSLESTRHQKAFWKVSALSYIRRVHELGLISDWQYKSLAIEATQAGYRRREGDIERETSQLIPKVLASMREEGIGLSGIASDLAIHPAELRGLLFSGLNVLEGGNDRSTLPSADLNIVR